MDRTPGQGAEERNDRMQLGMVGLGRMGANLVRRLVRDGHTCVVYDVSADVVSALAGESDAITGASESKIGAICATASALPPIIRQ